MNKNLTKRIMLVGESKVGKTSYINYLFKNRIIPKEHLPTTGVQAGIKSIQYQDGKFAVVQIWDSAGKHQLHQYVCQKFYGDIDGFLIIIEMDNENTLASVNYWSQKIKRVRKGSSNYQLGVIATKSDLPHEFTEQDFRRRYPSISFFKIISLLDEKDVNGPSKPQLAIYNFVRNLYGNQLPQKMLLQTNQLNTGCKCVIM